MRGWAKSGVLARIFEVLQQEQIIRIEVSSFDSTSIKVHPDGTRALKEQPPKALADPEEGLRPRFIRLPQMSRQRCTSPSQQDNVPTAPRDANS